MPQHVSREGKILKEFAKSVPTGPIVWSREKEQQARIEAYRAEEARKEKARATARAEGAKRNLADHIIVSGPDPVWGKYTIISRGPEHIPETEVLVLDTDGTLSDFPGAEALKLSWLQRERAAAPVTEPTIEGFKPFTMPVTKQVVQVPVEKYADVRQNCSDAGLSRYIDMLYYVLKLATNPNDKAELQAGIKSDSDHLYGND